MEYYKPLQYLGFMYIRETKEVYIKSYISVLTKPGETLAKYNSTLSGNLIQYRITNDVSSNADSNFRDVVLIKAEQALLSAVISETSRRDSGKATMRTSVSASVKVVIYAKDGTQAGTVTTTTPINDDADIEIR